MPLVTEANVHLQHVTNREYGGTGNQQAASMPFLFFLIALMAVERVHLDTRTESPVSVSLW